MLKNQTAARMLSLCALILCLVLPARVAAWDKIPDLTMISPGQTSFHLGSQASLLVDPEGKLTLDEVTSPAMAGRFRSLSSPDLNLAHEDEKFYWLRFSLALANQHDPLLPGERNEPSPWVLVTGLPLSDWTPWELYDSHRVLASRSMLPMGTPVGLEMGPLSAWPRTFYARFQNARALWMGPEVVMQSVWNQRQSLRLLLAGIFCGVILGSLLYSLFVYMGLRDHLCIVFAAQNLCVGSYLAGVNGLLYRYLVKVDPEWMNEINRILLTLTLFFTLVFLRRGLSLAQQAPGLDRFVKWFSAGTILLCPWALFLSNHAQDAIFSFWSLLTLAILTLVTVLMLRRSFSPARLFLLAWCMMMAGGGVYVLMIFRLIPNDWSNMYWFQLGMALGTVVLSLALVDRIRILRGEKMAAQAADQAKEDLIRFLPDATFAVDLKGRVTAWNRAMEKLSGIKAQDILGKGDYAYAVPFWGAPRPILIDMVLEGRRDWEKTYLSVEQEGDLLRSESFHPNFRPGGVYLFAVASPLYDTRGRLAGAIESVRDVTEYKTAQNETLARERLQSAVETAGAACHELNQPLQAVLSQVELAQMKIPANSPLGEDLNRLMVNIQKMTEITRRLSRITDYQTRHYVGQAQILDLARASGRAQKE